MTKDDDLRSVWAAHGAKLERCLQVNERLLREVLVRKMRWALAPYLGARALAVAVGVGLLAMIAPVVVRHLGEVRYALVGGAAVGFLGALTALTGYLLGRGASVRYERPVAELRGELERLALLEVRSFKWALLGGVVAWLPIALLVLESLSGIDLLARVDGAWLVANLVVGAALLGLGLVVARHLVERSPESARASKIIAALSGRGLRQARARLDELAAFERP